MLDTYNPGLGILRLKDYGKFKSSLDNKALACLKTPTIGQQPQVICMTLINKLPGTQVHWT